MTLKGLKDAETPDSSGSSCSFLGDYAAALRTLNRFDGWAGVAFGLGQFAKIELLDKGLSGDRKYYAETPDGRRLLLRVSDIGEMERKRAEFEILKRVEEAGVPAPRPVDFGVCDGGGSVYQLLTWVDGEDASAVLPGLPEGERYALGVKAGGVLRNIHAIPAPGDTEAWAARFHRHTDARIRKYNECGLRYDGGERLLAYIAENRHLPENRPQSLTHGDFCEHNLIVNGGTPAVIDFGLAHYGDPWDEFNRAAFSAWNSPHYATGLIRGYFGGEPPEGFFALMAFYTASNMLSTLYWAIPFGEAEVRKQQALVTAILRCYDGFNRVVPSWYFHA